MRPIRRISPISLITLAERVYRILLALYPTEFRQAYGAAMVQVFRDVSREQEGLRGLVYWWGATLFDLVRTALQQRREVMSASTFFNAKSAAVISIILCLPLLLMLTTATLNYEPAFVQSLEDKMMSSDGYTPTTLGRLIMLGMLFSLPLAFVVNLLPMLTPKTTEGASTFRLTNAHSIGGSSILATLLMFFSQLVGHELEPFVEPLGVASFAGYALFLMGLAIVPAMFLLNVLPKTNSGGTVAFRPTSINLIIGACILLLILMIASTFMLETIACSSGVPNCD
jgi:hypothetical protein